MKIVIIEDEHLASSYLKSILEQQSIISINEITIVKSVKDAVAFLNTPLILPLWTFIGRWQKSGYF